MALPVGLAVFVYLRGWLGALVLAAARVSGDSAGGLYAGDAAPGVLDGKVLRAEVHGFLRATGGHTGQLARPAEPQAYADGAASGGTPVGADWFDPQRFLSPIRLGLHRFQVLPTADG